VERFAWCVLRGAWRSPAFVSCLDCGNYPSITPDAFIDGALHGADITVDEWGTVAAAATALGFAESGPPEPELSVKADRPFLYLIRHRPTGLVLFAGQVTNPAS
jgi:serpin B